MDTAANKASCPPNLKHEDLVPCLQCQQCKAVVALGSDLFDLTSDGDEESKPSADATKTKESHVYRYPLDLDSLAPPPTTHKVSKDTSCQVWCYSATNAVDNRFDVIRIRWNDRVAVDITEAATTEHTWFPPYGWRQANCKKCQQHLGWSFSEMKADPPNESECDGVDSGGSTTNGCFYGLILTKLRETRVAKSALDDYTPEPAPIPHHAGFSAGVLARMQGD